MHAVFVMVDIDPARGNEAVEFLHDVVVPRVKGANGFVSGTWLKALDGTNGRSMLVFESEEAARAAAEMVRQAPPEGGPVTIQSAEVYEVAAQA